MIDLIRTLINDIKTLSPRLKTMLSVLTVLALLVVFRVFGFFSSHLTANISGTLDNSSGINSGLSSNNQTTATYNDVNDADGDGLADNSESSFFQANPMLQDTDQDGYYDGEEVITGFDPSFDEDNAKKEEAKKLAMESGNLTLALINRTVGGVLAGDLNSKELSSEEFKNNLQYVTLATIDEAIEVPSVDPNKILSSTNSKESKEQYLAELSQMVEPLFLTYYNDQQSLLYKIPQDLVIGDQNSANEKLVVLSSTFSEAADRLSAIRVPPEFSEWHSRLMEICLGVSIGFTKLQKSTTDPLLGMIALNKISGYMAETPTIIRDLRQLIENENLSVPDTTLFKTLSLLNNK